MRPITTLPIILAISALTAACSDQVSSLPTSPNSAVTASAQAQVQGEAPLPWRGSFTTADRSVVAPPSLFVDGTGEGNATHLGRFTMTYSATSQLGSNTATGGYSFTAANGDQLLTTFAGGAVDIQPGVVSFTEVATIVGGTGRFASATGTLILRRIGIIDFASGTSTSTGSFDGYVTLHE